MKKLMPLALLLLLLAACAPKAPAAAVPFDPAAAAKALNESAAFSEVLEPLDKDVFCALYGMDEAALTDGVVYASTGSTAEEFAIWTLPDEAAATEALAVLSTRLEDQKAANRDYRPQDMPKLDHAILTQRGNSVALVIASDAKAAQEALQ